jgi:hypothetical protein
MTIAIVANRSSIMYIMIIIIAYNASLIIIRSLVVVASSSLVRRLSATSVIIKSTRGRDRVSAYLLANKN